MFNLQSYLGLGADLRLVDEVTEILNRIEEERLVQVSEPDHEANISTPSTAGSSSRRISKEDSIQTPELPFRLADHNSDLNCRSEDISSEAQSDAECLSGAVSSDAPSHCTKTSPMPGGQVSEQNSFLEKTENTPPHSLAEVISEESSTKSTVLSLEQPLQVSEGNHETEDDKKSPVNTFDAIMTGGTNVKASGTNSAPLYQVSEPVQRKTVRERERRIIAAIFDVAMCGEAHSSSIGMSPEKLNQVSKPNHKSDEQDEDKSPVDDSVAAAFKELSATNLTLEEECVMAVKFKPVSECEDLLEKIKEVNAMEENGATLLHLAVELGKLDWSERLLWMGSDPSLSNNLGFTAWLLAEDMCNKFPLNSEREVILRLVRLASMLGGKGRDVIRGSETSCVLSSRDKEIRCVTLDVGGETSRENTGGGKCVTSCGDGCGDKSGGEETVLSSTTDAIGEEVRGTESMTYESGVTYGLDRKLKVGGRGIGSTSVNDKEPTKPLPGERGRAAYSPSESPKVRNIKTSGMDESLSVRGSDSVVNPDFGSSPSLRDDDVKVTYGLEGEHGVHVREVAATSSSDESSIARAERGSYAAAGARGRDGSDAATRARGGDGDYITYGSRESRPPASIREEEVSSRYVLTDSQLARVMTSFRSSVDERLESLTSMLIELTQKFDFLSMETALLKEDTETLIDNASIRGTAISELRTEVASIKRELVSQLGQIKAGTLVGNVAGDGQVEVVEEPVAKSADGMVHGNPLPRELEPGLTYPAEELHTSGSETEDDEVESEPDRASNPVVHKAPLNPMMTYSEQWLTSEYNNISFPNPMLEDSNSETLSRIQREVLAVEELVDEAAEGMVPENPTSRRIKANVTSPAEELSTSRTRTEDDEFESEPVSASNPVAHKVPLDHLATLMECSGSSDYIQWFTSNCKYIYSPDPMQEERRSELLSRLRRRVLPVEESVDNFMDGTSHVNPVSRKMKSSVTSLAEEQSSSRTGTEVDEVESEPVQASSPVVHKTPLHPSMTLTQYSDSSDYVQWLASNYKNISSQGSMQEEGKSETLSRLGRQVLADEEPVVEAAEGLVRGDPIPREMKPSGTSSAEKQPTSRSGTLDDEVESEQGLSSNLVVHKDSADPLTTLTQCSKSSDYVQWLASNYKNITSQGTMQEEGWSELLSRIRRHVLPAEESVDSFMDAAVQKDAPIRAQESRGISLTKELRSSKSGSDVDVVVAEPDPERDLKVRKACVDALLAIATCHGPSRCRNTLALYYNRIYSQGPLTSSMLKYLRFQEYVRIMVDFKNSHIGDMKPTVRDIDGGTSMGSIHRVHTHGARRTVYVAAKNDISYTVDHVVGWLAIALARMSIIMAFRNKGKPYYKRHRDEETQYGNILLEAELMLTRLGAGSCNFYIRNALEWKNLAGREIALISAVPGIISHYGYVEGINILKEQVPSLLQFYEEQVVTKFVIEEPAQNMAKTC